MSDISKIKIGDEAYNVKDARIVSGTFEDELVLEGSLIVLCLAPTDDKTHADLWINELKVCDLLGADVTMSGTTMTVNVIDPCDYIAIIKE